LKESRGKTRQKEESNKTKMERNACVNDPSGAGSNEQKTKKRRRMRIDTGSEKGKSSRRVEETPGNSRNAGLATDPLSKKKNETRAQWELKKGTKRRARGACR